MTFSIEFERDEVGRELPMLPKSALLFRRLAHRDVLERRLEDPPKLSPLSYHPSLIDS